VSIEIPWEVVDEERDRLVSKAATTTVIPGFRRGKAPKSLLYRHYDREIRASFLDGLIPFHLARAVDARKLNVASGPLIHNMRYSEGQPLAVEATYEVFADFELGEYRRLKIAYREPEVTEEMVADQLEDLRIRHASFHNVDPRPLADGDFAVVSLEAWSGGDKPEIQAEEVQIEIGHAATIQAYSDALRGRSIGEVVDFDVAYPDDFDNRRLAGKILRCHVEVLGIRQRELPNLDDEFAKDIHTDLGSLEELKIRVRKGVANALKGEAIRAANAQLIQQLAGAHPMPMPSHYLERRCANSNSASSGRTAPGDSEEKPMDEATAKMMRAATEEQVRAELILERIAVVEEIDVSEEEVENEVRNYAQSKQMTPAGARRELEEQGALAAWRLQRLRAKTLQFVFEEAERIEPPEPSGHEKPQGDAPSGSGSI
jgi:trigger factor